MIEFFIQLEVLPKQGDRAERRRGPGGRQWVQHFTSAKVKANAQALALGACRVEPVGCPAASGLLYSSTGWMIE